MKKIFMYAMLFMSMCLFTACPPDDDEDNGVTAYNSSSVSRKHIDQLVSLGQRKNVLQSHKSKCEQ